MVLDDTGGIWLLRKDDFALIGLALTGYRPDVMDCKIIFNPVYATVLFSDAVRIHAAVFTVPDPTLASGTVLEPFHTFEKTMSRAEESWKTRLADILFPCTLRLESENTSFVHPVFALSRHYLANALPLCLVLALGLLFCLKRRGPLDGFGFVGVAATALFGIYALVPYCLMDEHG
ncbi:MAG: hypothetical protein IJU76_11130 [Desulfovibrionaceae bacterium]|nr:hypothetical protein [Desulfovibrionaceae bacterium]